MQERNPDALLTIPQAAKVAGVSVQSVWRWALNGVRGGIKLPTALRGGRRYTSPRSIEQFFARLNAGNEPSNSTGSVAPDPLELAAIATLDAAGIRPLTD
jgi:predicted DNA-binding transcriptional regulator AlpA